MALEESGSFQNESSGGWKVDDFSVLQAPLFFLKRDILSYMWIMKTEMFCVSNTINFNLDYQDTSLYLP